MPSNLVLFDHDGGLDDYLALMLLLSYEHIDLQGVIVTPADCYIRPAVGATRKIIDMMGQSHVPVAESAVRGVNPFPRAFRRSSFHVDHFPILNRREHIDTPLLSETGQQFMVRALRAAPEPVVILETGPLTTIAAALASAPDIAAKIESILWMGGALNVPGNVSHWIDGGQDMSMEWNVYWDPISAHQVWQTDIPIILCPLDITNTVQITSDFVRTLSRRPQYPVSELAAYCYALVMHQDYYCWDVLTTAYLGRPDLFTTKEWEVEIIPEGCSQGRTQVTPGGKRITALESVEKETFFDHLLAQWAR
ncbi:MAG: nucleoside hydrolase [Caldilineales bacterium]|nr:nucleoside hydrolase [Caldilineales bacterium]